MPHKRHAQAMAERVAAALSVRDRVGPSLGIRVDAVAPGFARLTMTVTEAMLNGVDICHGGISYTLADTAFAYASNSHNRQAVAQACSITYTAAAQKGDHLTAECREVFAKGRSGVYDCTVTNQDGTVIALFRGQSRAIPGHVVEGTDP